jgi:hypothetical protein
VLLAAAAAIADAEPGYAVRLPVVGRLAGGAAGLACAARITSAATGFEGAAGAAAAAAAGVAAGVAATDFSSSPARKLAVE